MQTKQNRPTIIVTGGTSGVGRQTAIDLASRGCHVIILSRHAQSGQTAAKLIGQQTHNTHVESLVVDLTSTKSITQLINQCHQRFDHLDGLVNAAGAMFHHLIIGANGLDENLSLNYFGLYQLTMGLLPLLKSASQGRIINVAGLPLIVRLNRPVLPELTPSTPYNANAVFAQSLSARLLLTIALAKELTNTHVTVNSFHPGNVPASHFGGDTSWFVKISGQLLAHLSAKNTAVGAQLMTESQFTKYSGQFFDEHCRPVKLPAKYSSALADELLAKSQSWMATL